MQAIEKEPEVLTYEIVDDVDDAGGEGNRTRFDIKLEIFVDSASRMIGTNARRARDC